MGQAALHFCSELFGETMPTHRKPRIEGREAFAATALEAFAFDPATHPSNQDS
jgi:hypothetical protein